MRSPYRSVCQRSFKSIVSSLSLAFLLTSLNACKSISTERSTIKSEGGLSASQVECSSDIAKPSLDLTKLREKSVRNEVARVERRLYKGADPQSGYSAAEQSAKFVVDSVAAAYDGATILFGQADVTPTFGDGGSENLTNFVKEDGKLVKRGRSIYDVAERLRKGEISPDELRIDILKVNGVWIVVNNRSYTVLAMSGIKPTNIRVMTPSTLPKEGADSLPSILNRLDALSDQGSRQSWIRGDGIPFSGPEKGKCVKNWVRGAPIVDVVTLADGW